MAIRLGRDSMSTSRTGVEVLSTSGRVGPPYNEMAWIGFDPSTKDLIGMLFRLWGTDGASIRIGSTTIPLPPGKPGILGYNTGSTDRDGHNHPNMVFFIYDRAYKWWRGDWPTEDQIKPWAPAKYALPDELSFVPGLIADFPKAETQELV
jgi:hypothetical protein